MCIRDSYDPVPLVLAAQRGNQAAFDALISLYQYRILRQCRGFFLQGAEFEDVLQEGRIGFFHAVRSFSVHRSIPFDSYVSICVKRQLADAVRMFSRKKHRPLNTYVSFDSQTQSKSECLTPQFGCFSPEPLDPAEIMASKEMCIRDRFSSFVGILNLHFYAHRLPAFAQLYYIPFL